MDMEYMHGGTGIVMRESGEHVWGMATARISFLIKTNILDSTVTAILTVSGNTSGKMATPMQENFSMAWNMARVNGERSQMSTTQSTVLKHCVSVISLRVNIEGIRKTVMESSIGRVATYTRAHILKMWGKAMERCIGSMAIFSEATGCQGSKMELVSWYFQMALRNWDSFKKMCSSRIWKSMSKSSILCIHLRFNRFLNTSIRKWKNISGWMNLLEIQTMNI